MQVFMRAAEGCIDSAHADGDYTTTTSYLCKLPRDELARSVIRTFL
jgi:hypothetical protein